MALEGLEQLTWDRVLASDAFRQRSTSEQFQFRTFWMNNIAPQLYPQITTDLQARGQLQNHINRTRPIPIREWESEIITPGTTDSYRDWGEIETSPTFRRLNFQNQQEMKALWFQKMSANDESFRELDPENQEGYYRRLMERPAVHGVGTSDLLRRTGVDDTEVFMHWLPVETLWEGGYEAAEDKKRAGDAAKVLANFAASAVRGIGALPAGLATLVAGQNNTITQAYQDVMKMRDWTNMVNDRNNFLTNTLPSLAGGIAGILAGPYPAFERAFATVGGRALNMLLPRVPTIVGQTAGAAVSGAIYGIGAAISEGQPWHSNLATDATMGIGFEFAGRWVGALMLARKAAKQAGVPLKQMIAPAMDAGRKTNLTPALERVFSANPTTRQLVDELGMVNRQGLGLEALQKKEGVKMVADTLGLDVRHLDNATELWRGGNLYHREVGPENVRIRNTVNFMLDDPINFEVWSKTTAGKQLLELVETHPTVEMRRMTEVPVEARGHIQDFFKLHGQGNYFTAAAGTREKVLSLDEVYDIVKRSGPRKAASLLQARGVQFDGGEAAHRAATAQLKSQMDQLFFESPYFIVNASNKGDPKIVEIKDLPVHMIESPMINQPIMHEGVYVGNAGTIRNVLKNLNRTQTSMKRNATVAAKKGKGTATHLQDSDIVELRMSVPDGTGALHDVILHMPSLRDAERLLRTGATGKKLDTLLDDLFQGIDPGVRGSYDSFVKEFLKRNPSKYTSDFAPYAFATKMAREQGMHLGVVGGRYVLHDQIATNYRVFDNLNSVYRHLTEIDGRAILPDLTPGMSRSALEVAAPDSMVDPMRIKLDRIDHTAARANGLRAHAVSQLGPTQHAINYLESTEGGKLFREAGIPVTGIYNRFTDTNRAVTAFINDKTRTASKITRGLSKKKAEYVYKYMEGLDNPAERTAMGQLGKGRLTKSEIYDEMTQVFGANVADDIASRATEAAQFFDEMFVRAGLDWATYTKHYIPHMRLNMEIRGGDMNVKWNELTDSLRMSAPEREAFFEMMREADPRNVLMDMDVRRLMGMYSHMAARNIFIRPMIKDLAGQVNNLVDQLSVAGQLGDGAQVVRYLRDMFNSINGVHNLADAGLRDATQNIYVKMGRLADRLSGKKMPDGKTGFYEARAKSQTHNPIDTMIAWNTGAHLGMRGFSVARNLTQSLTTTGSLLGVSWWMDAVDKVMKPGSMQRMMDLGIVSRNAIPVAGWRQMSADTFIKKATSLGMQPFREADAINRMIAYTMGESRARHAFQMLDNNRIKDASHFARVSGAKLYGIENYNQIVDINNLARDGAASRDAVADRLGKLAVERTQYMYELWNQPQAFRNGVGRLFGQYTSWPLNFMGLVSEAMNPKSGMPVIQRAEFFTRLVGITGGFAAAMYEAGMNPAAFAPWNMGEVGIGPQAEMLMDGVRGITGDRDSLFRLVQNASRYYPFAMASSGFVRSVQAMEDGDFSEAFLHLIAAPMNYDVYPRREPLTQNQIDNLLKLANQYAETRRGAGQTRLISEGIEGVYDLFR